MVLLNNVHEVVASIFYNMMIMDDIQPKSMADH